MIDIRTEKLLPLSDLPAYLASRGFPVKVTQSTVRRWVRDGCDGARLEVVRIGAKTFTSLDAIQRWVDAQTASAASARGERSEPNGVKQRDLPTPSAAASKHYLIESRVVPTELDRVIASLDHPESTRAFTAGVLFRDGLRTAGDARRRGLEHLLSIDGIGVRSREVLHSLWAKLTLRRHADGEVSD